MFDPVSSAVRVRPGGRPRPDPDRRPPARTAPPTGEGRSFAAAPEAVLEDGVCPPGRCLRAEWAAGSEAAGPPDRRAARARAAERYRTALTLTCPCTRPRREAVL